MKGHTTIYFLSLIFHIMKRPICQKHSKSYIKSEVVYVTYTSYVILIVSDKYRSINCRD